MAPRIFKWGDRLWQFGDWEARLVCRTCKGERYAEGPTGMPGPCTRCKGEGIEVVPGKTLADLQTFVANLKEKDMAS